MPPDPTISTVLLLGDPVAGSLSPALQDAAFTTLGIDCRYLARQVLPEQLASVIDEIRADDRILGANVTIPHKESVVRLLDDLDDMAARIGAVNTISRRGSLLRGWNTDVEGFQRALAEQSLSPLLGEGRGGGYRTAAMSGAGGCRRAAAGFRALGYRAQPRAGKTAMPGSRDRARRAHCHGANAGNHRERRAGDQCNAGRPSPGVVATTRSATVRLALPTIS